MCSWVCLCVRVCSCVCVRVCACVPVCPCVHVLKDISMKVREEIISSKNWIKLLGVKIHSNLHFTEHVSHTCKKASQKLHALARVSKYMNKNQLCVLCKSFIESVP